MAHKSNIMGSHVGNNMKKEAVHSARVSILKAGSTVHRAFSLSKFPGTKVSVSLFRKEYNPHITGLAN